MNIDYTLQSRKNFVSLMNELSIDQLNQIPEGFNNSIIWNFGHTIITQQVLCYKLSGLPLLVEDELVETFRKGSKPDRPITEKEVEKLKILAMATLETLKNDLMIDTFKDFHQYTTSFGITLNNISEAVEFNGMHETMHLGYAKAMAKVILSQ